MSIPHFTHDDWRRCHRDTHVDHRTHGPTRRSERVPARHRAARRAGLGRLLRHRGRVLQGAAVHRVDPGQRGAAAGDRRRADPARPRPAGLPRPLGHRPGEPARDPAVRGAGGGRRPGGLRQRDRAPVGRGRAAAGVPRDRAGRALGVAAHRTRARPADLGRDGRLDGRSGAGPRPGRAVPAGADRRAVGAAGRGRPGHLLHHRVGRRERAAAGRAGRVRDDGRGGRARPARA